MSASIKYNQFSFKIKNGWHRSPSAEFSEDVYEKAHLYNLLNSIYKYAIMYIAWYRFKRIYSVKHNNIIYVWVYIYKITSSTWYFLYYGYSVLWWARYTTRWKSIICLAWWAEHVFIFILKQDGYFYKFNSFLCAIVCVGIRKQNNMLMKIWCIDLIARNPNNPVIQC